MFVPYTLLRQLSYACSHSIGLLCNVLTSGINRTNTINCIVFFCRSKPADWYWCHLEMKLAQNLSFNTDNGQHQSAAVIILVVFMLQSNTLKLCSLPQRPLKSTVFSPHCGKAAFVVFPREPENTVSRLGVTAASVGV